MPWGPLPGCWRTYLQRLWSQESVDSVWEVFCSCCEAEGPLDRAWLTVRSGSILERWTWTPQTPALRERLKLFRFSESGETASVHWEGRSLKATWREPELAIQVDVGWGEQPSDAEGWSDRALLFLQVVSARLGLIAARRFSARNRDDITRLYNQNYLKWSIEHEIARCDRYGGELVVVFFDLDNLREVNARHGHLVGTEVLRQVADILREGVRQVDLAARFGGDEFVMLLPNTSGNAAVAVCHRLLRQVRAHEFLKEQGKDIRMTGSFGIARYPGHGQNADDLIAAADEAMYQVKKGGKDNVMIFQGDQ